MKRKSQSALLLAGLAIFTTCQSQPSSRPSSFASASSPQTCESRTINYVTQSLLQQCFSTTRPNSSITAIATAESILPSIHSVDASPTSNALPTADTNGTTPSESTASLAGTFQVSSTTESHPSTVFEQQSSEQTPSQTESAKSVPTQDAEADSPLDNAKFLSFEEWKKQYLIDSGRVPEVANAGSFKPNVGRTRPGINNALDALGEDSEIEIDFGGFAAGSPEYVSGDAAQGPSSSPTGVKTDGGKADPKSSTRLRNKDAGRTCKERFNYASFDCAANVLKTNQQCKSSSSILVENKDSYMLNECSADNKFFIVELCNDVQIDTIVLANFEFFSSMFRTFKVSVSDRYPVKLDKWREIATYEAKNTREIQAFLVEDPIIYARYLRIEILTHYGSEYYCPVSLLRVHGRTMMEEYMEEYRREQRRARGENEIEDEEVDDESVTEQEPITAKELPQEVQVKEVEEPSTASQPPPVVDQRSPSDDSAARHEKNESSPSKTVASSMTESSPTASEQPTSQTLRPTGDQQASKPPLSTSPATQSFSPVFEDAICTPSTGVHASPSSMLSGNIASEQNSTGKEPSAQRKAGSSTQSPTAIMATPIHQGGPNAAQPPATAAPPAPVSQESFFKSIHKRLQVLEANATLSLQYIESQSQLLRDAFHKVEKRNIARASEFLATLNETVIAELARFKGEYEQLWQSTVLELASQRDEGRREREILGDRIRVLAEEIIAQRRLMIIEATVLLVCLALILFGKTGSHVDGGLVQSVQELVKRGRRKERNLQDKSRSLGSLAVPWESPWGSPSRSTTAAKSTETLLLRPKTATSDDEVLQPRTPDGTPDGVDEEPKLRSNGHVRRRRGFVEMDDDSEDTNGTADGGEPSTPEIRRTTTAPAATFVDERSASPAPSAPA